MCMCSICGDAPVNAQIYILCNGYVACVYARTLMFWENYPIVCSSRCARRFIYWHGDMPIIPM